MGHTDGIVLTKLRFEGVHVEETIGYHYVSYVAYGGYLGYLGYLVSDDCIACVVYIRYSW